MSATGANEALLRQAQALILACEPKPGRPFADAQSQIVVPDVVVQRSGRGFKVALFDMQADKLAESVAALQAQKVDAMCCTLNVTE